MGNVAHIPKAHRVPRWLRFSRFVSHAMERIVGCIAMVLVAVMLVIVLAQVVFRGFRASISWSEELSRMLLIWIGMLGAGIGFKHGAHVGIDIPYLSRRAALVFSILIKIAVIGFSVVFAYHSTIAAVAAQRVQATTLPWTLFGPKLALPTGSCLIALHAILLIAEDIAAWKA